MKKITKSCIALMLAVSIGMLSIGFTSHAVNVTKDYGIYRGVVSLTRYTSNGVKMVSVLLFRNTNWFTLSFRLPNLFLSQATKKVTH